MPEQKFEDYVYINEVCLSTVGLWPLPDGAPKWRFYLQNVHIFVAYISLWFICVIPEGLDLYMVWANIDAIVENICVTIYILSAVMKFSQMILKKNAFKDMLAIMRNDWDYTLETYKSNGQKNILLEYASFTRNLSKIFILLTYFIAIQLFCLPFVLDMNTDSIRKRWYPSRAWYYNFDQSSNVAYGFFYASQLFIGVGFGININLGLDTFCCIAISHTCAKLTILQRELLELGKNSKCSPETIKQLIQKHNHYIRVVHQINDIFSNVTLYQLLLSCIAICTSGFQLIVTLNKTATDLQGIILNTAFILIAFFQILLYCYPSNELMEQSLEVGNAAYQSLWINLSHSSRKEIKLLILRSQRPMTINAGKMYTLSLSRFISIVKAAMSCLSFLRASYERNTRYEN